MTSIQEGAQDSFPLQQKILVCSLLLLTRQLKTKEVTLGKVSWGVAAGGAGVEVRICFAEHVVFQKACHAPADTN